MTRAELRTLLLRQKWRFDVGRGLLGCYVIPVIRAGLLFVGLVWTARVGVESAAALAARMPLWVGFAGGLAYLVLCYAVGRLYIDVAEMLRAESRVSLVANAPMQEALSLLKEIKARV